MNHDAAASSVVDQLRHHETHGKWIEHLEGFDSLTGEAQLPDDEEMRRILRELDVPTEDIPAVIASRPDRTGDAEAWWLFERSVESLVRNMGSIDLPPWFPSPLDVDRLSPYFFVHVFVAMYPRVKDYHRDRGISEEQSRAILADLGRNMRVHRKRHGEGGLGVSFWLTLHFRGMIYQLGRLQFERSRMPSRIATALGATGSTCSTDDLVLSLHIPDYLGPLTPEAIDSSIEMAREFSAQHFPDEHYEYSVCHSWLLDPQLATYLPESSNIIQFQDRFTVADEKQDADRSIVQFVFGPVPESADDLPQRTSLERAVAQHLQAGHHWYGRSGWFKL